MTRIFTIAILVAASLAGQSTQNMGRTYTASQNVRYANEAGTGTTLHKLAKLTGAPSTAIIVATTDTSGIVGIVVAGAGNTGSADIAFAGKALCAFDSATTAGHYVVNDTSTAGDCMDAGATFPTTGQVIGVIGSTNGGAGTYEVDLTLKQPQAGGTGGGGSTTQGAFAALPGTCTSGDQYWPTDSVYKLLCSPGNTWNYYVNGYKMTPPILGDFTWVNQGGATAVSTFGGVYMTAPVSGGGSFRVLKKAAPATPYTITAAFIPGLTSVSYMTEGLAFRQSVDGKLATNSMSFSFEWRYVAAKFIDPTTYSADYTHISLFYVPAIIWLRIQDDGTDRISSFSMDGVTWTVLHTVGRTDFLTADEVGFAVDSNNATWPAQMWLIHWVES